MISRQRPLSFAEVLAPRFRITIEANNLQVSPRERARVGSKSYARLSHRQSSKDYRGRVISGSARRARGKGRRAKGKQTLCSLLFALCSLPFALSPLPLATCPNHFGKEGEANVPSADNRCNAL